MQLETVRAHVARSRRTLAIIIRGVIALATLANMRAFLSVNSIADALFVLNSYPSRCHDRNHHQQQNKKSALSPAAVSPRKLPAFSDSTPSTRRDLLEGSFLSFFLSNIPAIAVASEDSISADDAVACLSGALVPEQAIPGAYQQVCMALPVRTIPVTNHRGQTIPLKIQQNGAAAGSTGLAVWNSGLLMTRLLQRLAAANNSNNANNAPQESENKLILELGCGTGLVSLAAATMFGSKVAAKVIATDGNPSVVELAARNIESNANQWSGANDSENNNDTNNKRVEARQLQWGMLDAIDMADTADLVLGSDLTYNSGTWRALAETMATVVKPDGYIIYLSVGHTGFNVNAEVDGFLNVAQELGLERLTTAQIIVNNDNGGGSTFGWPFMGTGKAKIQPENLSQILLQECVSPRERPVLESTGGSPRVMVLARKRLRI